MEFCLESHTSVGATPFSTAQTCLNKVYIAYLNQVNVEVVYESVNINWSSSGSSSGHWLELEHVQQRTRAVGAK